ncbi:MAG TPA: TIGR04283 family arsenosugar biosynthesis glycosyltransferase [Allosphingosinicella sp.]|nr:TIGR04283 family arsenosugar biosynthesis glycosyltransferase [Allosphingosinicella sp.]
MIPTLNAAELIGPCLIAVGEADEVVVADGGSADATTAIAEREGARVIGCNPGRGAQLAAGARAARGDWLLFLHADTLLERGWRAAADRHIARQRGKAACFRLRLDAREWQARLIEAAVAVRVRMFGLPYGDQGLLVSRALYDSVGGFAPLRLMEDVDLVRRIGGFRIARLPIAAVTSAERWRRDGWLRRSGRNLACLCLYGVGVPPDRIARLYG